MKITRDVQNVSSDYQNAVIALGNFDGFHLGHRAIIAHAKAIAEAKNCPLALMTFEPHPRVIAVMLKQASSHKSCFEMGCTERMQPCKLSITTKCFQDL